MNFKPLGNRVLVEPIENKNNEKKSAGGIILAHEKPDKPTTGKIVAIGDEVKHLNEDLIVKYGDFGGEEIELDGKKYLLFKEHDIYGVITK
jgi:chaperonin GroES